MSGFSNYWKDAVLNHLFGKGGYTAPTIFVALSTTAPADDGSAVSEPAGGGYARVATGPVHWGSAADGLISNAKGLLFAQAAADWPTVTHFTLFDAASDGHLLAWGQLVVPITAHAGDTLEFAAASLVVRMA
ncbi:MAG TPA: hypothetical protein ENN81_12490 [Phycisphaerales bacterium]|nr:hypothetical protein [Phycisphaerales bacterium]